VVQQLSGEIWHFAARRSKDGNPRALLPASLTYAHRTAVLANPQQLISFLSNSPNKLILASLRPLGLICHLIGLRGKNWKCLWPGTNRDGFNGASIPPACEVCHEEPVTTLVADFIFACNVCAKRISAALWHGREERNLTAGSLSSEFRKVISPQ